MSWSTPANGASVCTSGIGGAVYQGMSASTMVRAMGIITGGDSCSSVYTKLAGVKAWDSSISVPLN